MKGGYFQLMQYDLKIKEVWMLLKKKHSLHKAECTGMSTIKQGGVDDKVCRLSDLAITENDQIMGRKCQQNVLRQGLHVINERRHKILCFDTQDFLLLYTII